MNDNAEKEIFVSSACSIMYINCSLFKHGSKIQNIYLHRVQVGKYSRSSCDKVTVETNYGYS